MISFSSAWAMVLRHIRLWSKDPNIPLMLLYWPVLDILTWGFLGAWIAQSQTAGFTNYESIAIICLLLYQISSRGTNSLNLFFHEELHSSNLVNLFSLPISLYDWIAGCIIFTAITISLITATCAAFSLLLYNIALKQILIAIGIFGFPLFLCSLFLGFISLAIVSFLGKRGMEIAWIASWFFSPFSGAYFPVSVLPAWGQAISSAIPMSYLFTAVRQWLTNGSIPIATLTKGFALSIIYTFGAIALFVWCFNRSKEKGLARLMD